MDAFVEAITSMVSNFSQSRDLAWRLLLRDTRAMYRQSLFGYVWLVLPPLATVFVWVFLNKQNLVHINTDEVPYPLFVMTGTVLWTAFNSSLMAMQGIMAEARGTLSKVNFPHEALILTAFGKSLLNSVPPVVLLVPALLFYGGAFNLKMLLFPVGFPGNVWPANFRRGREEKFVHPHRRRGFTALDSISALGHSAVRHFAAREGL